MECYNIFHWRIDGVFWKLGRCIININICPYTAGYDLVLVSILIDISTGERGTDDDNFDVKWCKLQTKRVGHLSYSSFTCTVWTMPGNRGAGSNAANIQNRSF